VGSCCHPISSNPISNAQKLQQLEIWGKVQRESAWLKRWAKTQLRSASYRFRADQKSS